MVMMATMMMVMMTIMMVVMIETCTEEEPCTRPGEWSLQTSRRAATKPFKYILDIFSNIFFANQWAGSHQTFFEFHHQLARVLL